MRIALLNELPAPRDSDVMPQDSFHMRIAMPNEVPALSDSDVMAQFEVEGKYEASAANQVHVVVCVL